MRLNRSDVRNHLDGIVESVISNSCGEDSILHEILMRKSPSTRRTLILGGMMRMAREDDHIDRPPRIRHGHSVN